MRKRPRRPSLENRMVFRRKSYLFSSLPDTTLFVAILTGTMYVFSFSFKQGFMDYYKITAVSLSTMSIKDLVSSSVYTLLLGFTISISYLIFRLMIEPLKTESEKLASLMFWIAFISFTTSFLSNSLFDIEFNFYWYIVTIVIPYFLIFLDHFFKKKNFPWYKKIRTPIVTPFSYLQEQFYILNSFRTFRPIMFLSSLIISVLIVEQCGTASAKQKEDYLTFKHKSLDYIIIHENQNQILVAPINFKTQTFTPTYQLIDLNSTLEDPFKFHPVHIEGGLNIGEIQSYGN
ncbi:hypothetical protein [Priestia filamentosa]|uniref:hypothetical protein n=1 Tax=Priestia filamentosa TaxID=1402861 RepID=UPI000E766FFE|nr:hypothetical protein [Priestia filamentosa]RJS63086.1 hypothetical protein CJ485_23050 [Priestia filamentosa]